MSQIFKNVRDIPLLREI